MGSASVGPYIYPHANFLELSFEKPWGGSPSLPDGWALHWGWGALQGISSASQSTIRAAVDGAYHLRVYALGYSQSTSLRETINAVPYRKALVRLQGKMWISVYGNPVYVVSDGTGAISVTISSNSTTTWTSFDSGWQTIPADATYLYTSLNVADDQNVGRNNDFDALTVTFSLPTPSTRDDPRLAGARGRILEWPFGLASQGYGRGIRGIEPLTLPTPRR